MRVLAVATFVFFACLSVLIYLTKNYQYEKYLIEDKTDFVKIYKVNINLANAHEFANLPGIGEGLASEIVKDRKEFGRFNDVTEIQRVKGIGRKKYEQIAKYLTLEVQ